MDSSRPAPTRAEMQDLGYTVTRCGTPMRFVLNMPDGRPVFCDQEDVLWDLAATDWRRGLLMREMRR